MYAWCRETVPPRWVMEPQDVRASEGMSRLVLHCHADGFPPPAVSWRRASGKKPGNYRDIVTHEHAQNLRIHSNGSLVFGRVQEDHEGFYLCEAVNGIGAGLSKVVHLTVNGKIIVAYKFEFVLYRGRGSTDNCLDVQQLRGQSCNR